MLPKFFTKEYPLEKHFLLVPRFALRIIGFYPETEATTVLRLWAFVNFLILTVGNIAEGAYGIAHITTDIVAALDALCPVLSSILSLIKMLSIWWYARQFRALIQRLRFLTEQQTSPAKVARKQQLFTLATRLAAVILFFGTCTSMSYGIRQSLNMLFSYLKGMEVIFETPFKMVFPKWLLSMPVYPVTFLLSQWHGHITVVCFVGADGFFVGFCLYIASLVHALKYDLCQVLAAPTPEHKALRQRADDKLCIELTAIIDRHNEIAQLTEQLSAIMVEITLAHFVTSGIIIGTSMIVMMLFGGYGLLVYVSYTCAVVSEIFLYCLGGTYIVTACNEFTDAAVCSQWYAHSLRVQKMVLLLIIRSQRVLMIQLPFFSPSYETMTSILRFTGSLIALANSVL